MDKIIPAYPLAIAGPSASVADPPSRRKYTNDSVKKACSEAGLYDIQPYNDHVAFPYFEQYTSYHTDIKNKSESQMKDDVTRSSCGGSTRMQHGYRPGVIVNMKVTELHASQPETVEGQVWRVVRVAEHKTSDKYMAQIGLEPYVYDMLTRYLQIRAKVLASNGKTGKVRYVLVYSNGGRLRGPSEMLARFHKKNGMTTHYTRRQARQTFETWSKYLSPAERQDVSEYLAHSTDVAQRRYFNADPKRAANIANNFDHMVTSSRQRGARMPARQSPAVATLQPTVSLARLEPGFTTPVKGFAASSPPGQEMLTPSPQKRASVFAALVKEFDPVDENTAFPPPLAVAARFKVKKDRARQICDSLRHYKCRIIHEKVAVQLLESVARRQRVQLMDLQVDDVNSLIPQDQKKFNALSTKNLQRPEFARQLRMYYNMLQSRSSPVVTTQDETSIVSLIEGRGVVVGERWIRSGSVVCDYHGNLVTRAEGRRRMYEYQVEEDGNYMFEFKYAEQFMCIDAATVPCESHPDIPTTCGRLINHSAKAPNLNTHKMVIDKKVAVLFVAVRDLQPNEELNFDYGVRRNEDGENTSVEMPSASLYTGLDSLLAAKLSKNYNIYDNTDAIKSDFPFIAEEVSLNISLMIKAIVENEKK
ncbi:SETD8 [Mytilus edulis]|uniref:SETD8 n=1 Tax=Mytilus edulis TaxID=6550 RepID=A0A8S3S2R8_MYTED|nr:SETD8 [Mytilus edulis]